MDLTFINSLYEDMEYELLEIGSSPEFYSSRLSAISVLISGLKEHVLSTGFSSDEEETVFFRDLKPRFYMRYIFEVELYNLHAGVPVGTDEMVRDYYLSELSFIKRFFSQQSFLYGYYARGEEAMDGYLFLRRNFDPLTPDVAGSVAVTDDGFSTNGDYLFSKFRALEKLQDYILERIRLIYVRPEPVLPEGLVQFSKLTWTDEKIKLVELAYGIFLMRSINEGKLEIADIIGWLERSLNIDLGVAYRKFISIGRRKNLSFTKYLDEMKDRIVNYIAEKNKYVPKFLRDK